MIRTNRTGALAAFIALACLLAVPAVIQVGVGLSSIAMADPTKADSTSALLQAINPFLMYVGFTALLVACIGRLWLVALLLSPALLWLPAELFYLIKFQAPTSAHVFAVIAETNWAEASSWLGPLVYVGALMFLVLLAAAAWLVSALRRTGWYWCHRSRWWTLVGMLLGVAILGGAELSLADSDNSPAGPVAWAKLEVVNHPAVADLALVYPYGLVLRAGRYLQHAAFINEHVASLRQRPFDLLPSLALTDSAVYVLVIGESSRPDRWQLFGYGRATTPRLAARDNLVSFGDVITPASATRVAVPLIFSRRPLRSEFVFHEEPSLITAFRQAGFRTYWLSAQAAVGTYDTSISALAKEADETRFVNPAEYTRRGAYDGELLSELDRVLTRAEPRQLIVLHTLGSHTNYRHRYPDTFDIFQPALEPDSSFNAWDPAEREVLSNTYDNSIAYTDWLLDQVIERRDRRSVKAGLLYVSDHGQTLFEGSCGKAGHGFPSVHNYRVPMFAWVSPEWIGTNRERFAALSANSAVAAVNRNVFETTLGMAGINFQSLDPTHDLGSRNYVVQRREIILNSGRVIDFDKEFSSVDCAGRGRK